MLRGEFEKLASETTGRGRVVELPSGLIAVGAILIDGTFDNPNYWMRVKLLREAIGFDCDTIGLVGPWASERVRTTFARFGIPNTVQNNPDLYACLWEADRLLKTTKLPKDILSWSLPEAFPATILYDGVLKLQRNATVDLTHPEILTHVAQALAEIYWAKELVESRKWAFFVLSHAVGFRCGALAWLAARNGIPCVVAMGNFGTLRLWKIQNCSQIADSVDRPSASLLKEISRTKSERLAFVGARVIAHRINGRAQDLGALYAYHRSPEVLNRHGIANFYGWPQERPIVAVYASNWFDQPHGSGMTQYTDYYEWIQITLDQAIKNDRVSWLFRAHPADVWYGGMTLSDVFPTNCPSHVRLCPATWNGGGVISSCDAFVTCVGTVGIEATAIQKPVLAAGKGFYHDCGFVVWAETKEQYIEKLASEWWQEVLDMEAAARLASIFAGYYFGIPDWQIPFVAGDDSEKELLYPKLMKMLERTDELSEEVDLIRAWIGSDARFYHTYKMLNSESYADVNLG